jgi:hypothetical protein
VTKQVVLSLVVHFFLLIAICQCRQSPLPLIAEYCILG